MQLAQYIRDHTTVTDFAKKIGRSRAQVHRYIKGENLSKTLIDKICEETGGQVQPADFFTPQASAA